MEDDMNTLMILFIIFILILAGIAAAICLTAVRLSGRLTQREGYDG